MTGGGLVAVGSRGGLVAVGRGGGVAVLGWVWGVVWRWVWVGWFGGRNRAPWHETGWSG